jgi:DNA topoisomerase VI subunit A
VAIPLGTREVESYAFPSRLYDKILFVERKDLWPVSQAAGLAEKYDRAIVAGEGYAIEVCRVLFAHADRGRKYELAVMHDADPHGYKIARTLREVTVRRPVTASR